MSALGINYDLDKPRIWAVDLAHFATHHIAWVRIPLRWNINVEEFVSQARRYRINVLGVLDRLSMEVADPDWVRAARAWRPRLAGLDAIQIGNEADHRSPSSWTLNRGSYQLLTYTIRDELRDLGVRLISSGAASGIPGWYAGFDFGGTERALHPYGRRPGNYPSRNFGFGSVEGLIADYSAVWGPGKIWVTEWGVTLSELLGHPGTRPQFVSRMTAALRDHPSIEVAFAFCAGEYMVPAYGWGPDEWKAFLGQAPPVYQIGQGVRARMTQLGDIPRSSEVYFNDELTGESLYSLTQGRGYEYRWTPGDGVKVRAWSA